MTGAQATTREATARASRQAYKRVLAKAEIDCTTTAAAQAAALAGWVFTTGRQINLCIELKTVQGIASKKRNLRHVKEI